MGRTIGSGADSGRELGGPGVELFDHASESQAQCLGARTSNVVQRAAPIAAAASRSEHPRVLAACLDLAGGVPERRAERECAFEVLLRGIEVAEGLREQRERSIRRAREVTESGSDQVEALVGSQERVERLAVRRIAQ